MQHACHICSKKVVNLNKHLDIHLGQKSFFCVICDKVFGRADKLERHTLIHNPNKDFYKCDKCGKRFQRSDKLKRHIIIHSSQKPFICTVCKMSYNRKDWLTKHMKYRHSSFKTKSTIKTELVESETVAQIEAQGNKLLKECVEKLQQTCEVLKLELFKVNKDMSVNMHEENNTNVLSELSKSAQHLSRTCDKVKLEIIKS